MKKSLFFSCLGLAAMVAGLAVAGGKTAQTTKAEGEEFSIAAENWTRTNGAGVLVATDIDDGVRIGNLHAFGADMVLNEKVLVDGLSFNIDITGRSSAWSNALGFYLSDSTAYGMKAPTVSIWLDPYACNQTRIHVGADHNYNTASLAHPSMSADTGFAVAASMVCNKTEDFGLQVTFNYVDADWWKLTFEANRPNSMWGNNANYSADGNGKCFVYLNSAELGTSITDYKAYLHVVGLSGQGGECKITNFKNGSLPNFLVTAQNTATKNVKSCYQELLYDATTLNTVRGLVDAAVEDIAAATTIEQIDSIVSEVMAAIAAQPKLPVSQEWTTMAGDPEKEVAFANGNDTVIKNYHTYGAYVTKNKKVAVDGLKFSYKQQSQSNSDIGGFWLSPTTNGFMPGTATFALWPNMYSGQDRLVIGESHDPAKPPLVFRDPNLTINDTGVATSIVLTAHENPGFTVQFRKVNELIYSISVGEYYPNTVWSNNANYNSASKTSTVYIKAEDLGVGADGKAYLNVYGWNNHYACIENLVEGNGATQVGVAYNYVKMIEAIDPTLYPTNMTSYIEGIKKQALDLFLNNVGESMMMSIYNSALNAINATLRSLTNTNGGLTVMDPTANAEPRYAGAAVYGTKRLDNAGAVTVTMNDSYGTGFKLKSKYDVLNLEMVVNFAGLPVGDAANVTFSSNNSYISEANYFHFEFFKLTNKSYQVILGNGQSHNVSDIQGWQTSNYNTYTGRVIHTNDETFSIKVTTQGGNTRIDINEQSIVLPTATLVNNVEQVGTSLKAGISIGVLNDKSERADSAVDVSVLRILDKDMKAYVNNLDSTLATVQAEIVSSVNNTLALAGAGLTDETVGAYREALASTESSLAASNKLTDYDYLYYFSRLIQSGLSALDAPLAAYNAQVKEAKDAVYAMLDEYDASDYSETNAEVIAQIKDSVEGIIGSMDIVGDVVEAGETIKASLDAVLTAEEEAAIAALASKKNESKSALQTYANLGSIEDDALLTTVSGLVSSGKTAIDACETITAVETKLAEVKGQIDAVKALFNAKVEKQAAVDEFEAALDMSKYSSDNKTVITDAISTARTAIDNATTIEAVSAAYTTMEEAVTAVPEVEKGCGGSILAASGIVTLVSMLGLGLAISKRKED